MSFRESLKREAKKLGQKGYENVRDSTRAYLSGKEQERRLYRETYEKERSKVRNAQIIREAKIRARGSTRKQDNAYRKQSGITQTDPLGIFRMSDEERRKKRREPFLF